MRFIVSIIPTHYSIQPAHLARALEDRGFEAMFVTEHTHIPVCRETPFYLPGELPKDYLHAYDPFVALTLAATATTRLKLGTGVCLVSEHSPITLAKQVASLDFVSGGRFVFGIGAGWNAEEMADHGVAFNDRWAVTRERVLAMRNIWTQDEPEFHGDHVDFGPLWSWPKPVQPGGPKVLLGANSRWTFDRIADYCDGWLAIDASFIPEFITPEQGKELLRESAERADRPFSDFTIAVGAPVPEPARIEQLVRLGVDSIAFVAPSEPADTVMPALDEWARFVEAYP